MGVLIKTGINTLYIVFCFMRYRHGMERVKSMVTTTPLNLHIIRSSFY